jgi:hypothetical protein
LWAVKAKSVYARLPGDSQREELQAIREVVLRSAKALLARLRSRVGGEETGSAELAKVRSNLAKRNETLNRVRQQLAKRDREIANLQEKLARRSVHSARLPEGHMPVFFLVGRGRSGTTWLRGMLNSHPEILCWGEGRFFERNFKLDLEQSQPTNLLPNSLYGAILESRHLRAWIDRAVWAKGKDTDEHLANLARLAIDYFLAEQLSKTEKKIVGDKSPYVSAEVFGEIAAIYPEARVIHIIRDGRDTAVSLMHHMWNYAKDRGGIYDLEPEELERRDAYRSDSPVALAEGLFTKERLTSIASDWSSEVSKAIEDGPALLGDNYIEVRYEDLLERPVEEVRRLLEFLGADAGEKTVEELVEKSAFEQKSNRERGQEDSSSRLRKGVAGDWKNVFTAEDKRIFKEVAGDVLIRLGYERDSNW